MADPKHVEVVKRGVAAISEWRRKYPKQTLNLIGADLSKVRLSGASLLGAQLVKADLSKADLSEANLSHANLSDADLHESKLLRANLSDAYLAGANLIDADLSGACLHGANLAYVNLIKADLHGANLSDAEFFESKLTMANLRGVSLLGAVLSYIDLTFADLSEADLSNADLTGAKFVYSDLSGSKFNDAKMSNTTFGSCNLAKCVGLKTVKHEGPSNIDLRTLEKSFRGAGNCFTSELETFFLNSGISKEFLETLKKTLAEVKYCSSFVCYGQPDLKFAETLVKDLKARGASCWLYSMDATPGERTWREITQKRREAEKIIVICSAQSLVRNGVLKEIEEQIDEDPEKIVPISVDNLWKQNGFSVKRGQRDLKPFLLERNYADFIDKSKYEVSLKRLLKGLKRGEK